VRGRFTLSRAARSPSSATTASRTSAGSSRATTACARRASCGAARIRWRRRCRASSSRAASRRRFLRVTRYMDAGDASAMSVFARSWLARPLSDRVADASAAAALRASAIAAMSAAPRLARPDTVVWPRRAWRRQVDLRSMLDPALRARIRRPSDRDDALREVKAAPPGRGVPRDARGARRRRGRAKPMRPRRCGRSRSSIPPARASGSSAPRRSGARAARAAATASRVPAEGAPCSIASSPC